MRVFIYILLSSLILPSCFVLHPSSGGGQRVNADSNRQINIKDIKVPDGYKIEVVATGLTFPTGIAFDENSVPYITESGYSYGEVFLNPKLLKINSDGSTTTIFTAEGNGPWNGVFFHEGRFLIAEGGQKEGGKILSIDKSGNSSILVKGLPSLGDHHTNGPIVADGYIYFGQGTATNSGVVGEDNYQFGWLSRYPEFHDIPCKDVKLTGENFTSSNFLNQSNDKVVTGPYLPFGTSSTEGQTIKGEIPCTGAVFKLPVNGGPIELVAWGFRNPFGFGINENGDLYLTENGYDVRGSRPVWGTGDYLWKVEEGGWYGWPDFSGGHVLSEGHLKVPGKGKPSRILKEFPAKPPTTAAILGVHSSSNGFDFSTSQSFGFIGEAFIAQFGDMAPDVGKVIKPVGFKVVRANVNSGVVEDFVVNKKYAPASKLGSGGIERPIAARFSPDGSSLYIVDFGILMMTKQGPKPLEKTGVVWKVSKK